MAIIKAVNEMATEMGLGTVSTVAQLRKFVREVCDLTDVQIASASLTCMGEWLGIL